MVTAASTECGGRQRDVARVYFENGAPTVARGGFYAWLGPPLEATMAGLSHRALDYARAQPLDVPPLMRRFARDWHIVDSTTVRLLDELITEYPGAGRYAALKVHKRLSVGTGTVYSYHLSPAREHDSPHLVLDESWRGLGLLVDLGYASLRLLSDCTTYGISATEPAVRALLHASLISSMLACLRVHRHRLKQAPAPYPDAERTTPPLHPQSLTRAMGSAASSLAGAFELRGEPARKKWQQLSEYLAHMAQDPNWRRSPSILDPLRGWRINPGRPKPARLSSSSRGGGN